MGLIDMKIAYIEKSFRPGTMQMIDKANIIIREFSRMGLYLTLRQLYYQFVSRGMFPEDRRWAWTGSKWVRDPEGTKNAPPNYKWLGTIIRDARLAGLIDWKAIEDRTRKPVIRDHTESAEEAVKGLENKVDKDRWADQDVAVEVWIEKDALTGVIRKPCGRWDVPYFACKGYNSSSAAWLAGQRVLQRDKPTVILHLGDHDPSGIDMTNDTIKRFDMFTGGKASVDRIALNMDQIEEFDPPSDPAKMGDSRSHGYVEQFGYECWELDALNPQDMQSLIEGKIKEYIDFDKWGATAEIEFEENRVLDELIFAWPRIRNTL